MIMLVEPCERYLKSYMEAYEEFMAEGISAYGLTNGRSCDIFQKFENYRLERNLPSDRVGSHYLWLVDEERDYFIGEISIRHRLNDALRRIGGHIGYCVRKGEWGKGYGTKMLGMALDTVKELGITRPLITCHDSNIASARVMEKNGFLLEDKVVVNGEVIRHYRKTL